MNPADVLKELFRIDRRLGKVIYAGLAVLAAAAIVISWEIDIESAVRVGLYMLALAVAVFAIASIAGNPLLSLFLGWSFALMMILSAASLFVSAVFQPRWIAPPYCLVKFWLPCSAPGGAGDEFAESKFTPVNPVQPDVAPPPANEVKTSEYRVFVQFAGVIRREDVRAMMKKLGDSGWQVQGAAGGGERTTAAIGYNEIRYSSPDDEKAARKLAIEVQGANLVSKPIKVQKINGIRNKTLEV